MIASSHAITFPRSVRLRVPQQFQHVFSQGRRISSALFRLHACLHLPGATEAEKQMSDAAAPSTTRSTDAARIAQARIDQTRTARLGISVSKRVAAHAAERNRIKRIARESFRHRRVDLPPGDYVLLAQRDAANASAETLRESLAALWQRAGALKPALAAPTMPARAGIDAELP